MNDPVVDRVLPRLAEMIRGSARNPDGADHVLSDAEAERHAREVWEELRAQDPDSFPVLAERLGLRFYIQPGDDGRRVLSAHAWDEPMWRTIGEIELPG